MSIQVNGNANAVNWESLLSKLGDVQKTTAAEGAGGATQVTITTSVNGVATPVTIQIPDDLEIPGEVDQAAIDSLCEKLAADTGLNLTDEQIAQFHDALSATLKETLSAVPGDAASARKSAMFDLYKLMALLVEVAQKQRDASREMRQAENMAIQKSILDQAASQREAAMTGMIAGAICCAIQVVATSVAMYKQSKAFNSQLGTEKSAGLDVARQNVNMLESADTKVNADRQLMKVKTEVGQKMSLDGHTNVETKVEGSFSNPEFNKASARLTSAENAFQKKMEFSQELGTLSEDHHINQVTSQKLAEPKFNQPEAAGLKRAVQKFEACKAEMDVKRNQLDQLPGLTQNDKTFIMEAKSKSFSQLSMAEKTKLMNLQAKHPEIGNIDFTTDGKTLAEHKADVRAALTDWKAKIDTQISGPMRNELLVARENFRAQTQLEMQKFETAYNSTLQNYNEVRTGGTKAEIAAAETKLQTAANELKYARAYGNSQLMRPDVTDAKAHLMDVEAARTKYATAQTTRANNVDYIKASNTINTAQATNNLISAIGSFAQGFVQNLTQMQQARATEVGAVQKKAEEELDQTRDLFNQAEELVNSIVQLMNAVRQAEVQSMRDAIQA